uniref:ZAD domain-containing protein n=1 Tax=Anopheles epiroticus TaxID=199890 RepID=A0A182PEI8_9DIPT
MENIENIDTLCRVCSSAGSHSIFGRIPAYCHEHYREYARWKQPIFMLIAEVTGIEITENDGLPKRICVLCISYLKHAYTFRRQAIDNIAGLLTAKYLSNLKPESKKSTLEREGGVIGRDEIISTADGTAYRSVNLANAANARSAVKQTTKKPAVMHRFVAKPPNNNAEEELDNMFGEVDEPTGSGLFGYREKEFIEDDVMELDGLQEHGVTFTLPEDYKEKKCFACRKRFMFSETYSQHLTECLLYKLTEAIRQLYHIMFLREQNAISAFEFIRRAVFTVRKSYRLVLSFDGELDEDEVVGEPTDATDGCEPVETGLAGKASSTPTEFLTGQSFARIELDSLSDSESCGSPKAKPTLIDPLRFRSGMNNALAAGRMVGSQPIILRTPDSFVSHTNVDIIKNRLMKTGAEEVNESNGNDRYKTIRCKQCEARFFTISHLDEHTIKVHQRPVRKNPFGL